MTAKPAKNFMPPEPTDIQFQAAQTLIEDEHIMSDDSGMNNKQKWARVCEVFRADKATLFSTIDYADVYRSDEPRTAEAAAFICDLRAQYLKNLLAEFPDSRFLHESYVENRQWHVRLRERARLQMWQLAAKTVTKPH